MTTGVLKGTMVTGLTSSDGEYLKVLDPGTGMKSEGTPWFIPVRLFESLTEEDE